MSFRRQGSMLASTRVTRLKSHASHCGHPPQIFRLVMTCEVKLGITISLPANLRLVGRGFTAPTVDISISHQKV